MKGSALFCIVSIVAILVLLILKWYIWALLMLAIAIYYGFVKRKWFDDGTYSF